MEWRLLVVIDSIDSGLSIKKKFDTLMMASLACVMEYWGVARFMNSSGIY